MKYYRGSAVFTAVCLTLAALLGYAAGGAQGAVQTVFIVAVLGVLETSLSFDNAVVNAKVLTTMDAIWRRRFLTWGIAIAVFGMRIVFPLLIVGIAGHLGPIEAVTLAVSQPAEYERILTSVHAEIAAFGGAFLLMVGLRYFFDEEKDVHWVRVLEAPLVKAHQLYMAEAAAVAVVLLVCTFCLPLPAEERLAFLSAGVGGLVTYAAVQWLEVVLGEPEEGSSQIITRTGAAAFIYLEVLDASFSFDGVIGAFALSNNIFVIALGLGIGAMFVRSMTVMLVDKGTLGEYRYLEHGAFWAILGLGACMLGGLFVHIPEVITGLIGAALIGLALWSSILANKREATTVKAVSATTV